MFCAICLMLGFRVTSEAIGAGCAESVVPTGKWPPSSYVGEHLDHSPPGPLAAPAIWPLAAADFSTVHLELEFKGMNHAQGHDLNVGEILAALRAGIRHDLPATTKQAIPPARQRSKPQI